MVVQLQHQTVPQVSRKPDLSLNWLHLQWSLLPLTVCFQHVNVTEAGSMSAVRSGYKVVSIPDFLLNQTGSTIVSLQARNRNWHQQLDFVTRLKLSTFSLSVKPSLHPGCAALRLPLAISQTRRSFNLNLMYSSKFCSVPSATSPLTASRDHVHYGQTPALKDQETPVSHP